MTLMVCVEFVVVFVSTGVGMNSVRPPIAKSAGMRRAAMVGARNGMGASYNHHYGSRITAPF
jgi:hypothetical protein